MLLQSTFKCQSNDTISVGTIEWGKKDVAEQMWNTDPGNTLLYFVPQKPG